MVHIVRGLVMSVTTFFLFFIGLYFAGQEETIKAVTPNNTSGWIFLGVLFGSFFLSTSLMSSMVEHYIIKGGRVRLVKPALTGMVIATAIVLGYFYHYERSEFLEDKSSFSPAVERRIVSLTKGAEYELDRFGGSAFPHKCRVRMVCFTIQEKSGTWPFWRNIDTYCDKDIESCMPEKKFEYDNSEKNGWSL